MLQNPKLAIIKKAVKAFEGSLEKCMICPRRCGVNRKAGKVGYCRSRGQHAVIYSSSPHHGEEPPISGHKGSGTIFFSHCNMKCVYCQNYYFSQLDAGSDTSIEELASIMLCLQASGCHNINLVSPTHYVPHILMAMEKAVTGGLQIPIVYNTSGYELVETIRKLEGVVDIYLPDMRYSDNTMARTYSDATDYVEYSRKAVLEMKRQVGDIVVGSDVVGSDGIAKKGVIIRLLVLPEDISGTRETLKFIKDEMGNNALSLMSQYYTTFKGYDYPALSRGITENEYKNIVDYAKLLGLNNGWVQEWSPSKTDPRFLGTNIKPKDRA